MKALLTIYCCLLSSLLFAADSVSVYPGNWFTGMKNPNLQLMLHGKDIGLWNPASVSWPGVSLQRVLRVKSQNYLFIDLRISPTTRAGNFQLTLHLNGKTIIIPYRLLPRAAGNGIQYAKGIRSEDLVYLIMPDRFSNGDPANDSDPGARDTVTDRHDRLARHGGDLQGVINHLDYIQQLGVTSIWLTPVTENDMPREKESAGPLSGYHGYWITDQYRIDPRFGGETAYHRFIDSVHARGMKVIQDAVYNHIGATHWWMTDLPDSGWINTWPSYQNANHREETMYDPHGAASDKHIMEAGWFVPHLPDLNLAHPLLANFMIQNAIWMTQTFGLDGWRIDTYKYCDEHFLNRLNAALLTEFPRITGFGEAWVNSVPAAAYFCRNNLDIPFKHNLDGVLDFPVAFSMLEAAKTGGDPNRLYSNLAQDFLYKQPLNNCIFLDNHDMNRFFSEAGEDLGNFKIGIGLLLTTRGIPQLYYGTEILMKNFKSPSDAQVRDDFPGGFPGDKTSKFEKKGRTTAEQDAVTYVERLAAFRKTSSALDSGAVLQYVPKDKLYVFFRRTAKQTIMIAVNADTTLRSVLPADYTEGTAGFNSFSDVITGNRDTLKGPINLPARGILIAVLRNERYD